MVEGTKDLGTGESMRCLGAPLTDDETCYANLVFYCREKAGRTED